MEYIKIVKYSFTPRPEPGWIIRCEKSNFHIESGFDYLLSKCDCLIDPKKDPPNWPDRNSNEPQSYTNYNSYCGAHLSKCINGIYIYTELVAYKDYTGWTSAAEGCTILPHDIKGNIISLYQTNKYKELHQCKEPISKKAEINLKPCPQCGGLGEDLIFSFYCRNLHCNNYHK